MILITSGAYLQGEFVAEVGLIPPSCLPIGNKRLYEYQVKFIRQCLCCNDLIYISVPSSYVLDEYDLRYFSDQCIETINVPDGFSLGDSILYCWNATAKHYSDLTILHGDTLFLNASFRSKNAITVHKNRGFYQRATLGDNIDKLEKLHADWSNDSEQVISGFFRFSEPLYFMKSLVESKSDFVKAIVNYHMAYPLEMMTEGEWLDFGHINSFYHSRASMTTQRAFNDLKIDMRTVRKSSNDNPKKIYAEGAWFEKLPLPLRIYTPHLLQIEKGGDKFNSACYQLEYLYLLPLSDLFVFGRLAKTTWQSIFKAVSAMLDDFLCYKPDVVDSDFLEQMNGLYLEKTLNRLGEFSSQSGFDVSNIFSSSDKNCLVSLLDVAYKSSVFINPAKKSDVSVIHGDLCFSNVLYDSRVGSVKCIDPRGITPSGNFSIYGDRRYDLAKLYHSVVGLYDFVIADRFYYSKESNKSIEFFVDVDFYDSFIWCFRDQILSKSGYNEKEILAISIHLFLSMLPLHADRPDRQQAFIANAFRLYSFLGVDE